MTRPYRILPALSLVLFPLVASAQAPGAPASAPDLTFERIRLLNEGEMDKPYLTRHILLRQWPTARVEEIYVAGGRSTIVHLPFALHTRGTVVGSGGEGRFEVLKGDRKAVITPTRALAKAERFPMVVTLADGTVIPLTLTSASEHARTDVEVQISREPERPDELRVQLVSLTEKALNLEARLGQALKEQESEDYALADLFAGGHAGLAAFVQAKDRSFVDGARRKIRVDTYASSPDAPRAANQVVAMFAVPNTGTEPLEFSAARGLSSMGEYVFAAFRMQPRVIPPGETGQIAVVLDRASFEQGKVSFDFYSKARGGQSEFSVDLTSEDFEVPESHWWQR